MKSAEFSPPNVSCMSARYHRVTPPSTLSSKKGASTYQVTQNLLIFTPPSPWGHYNDTLVRPLPPSDDKMTHFLMQLLNIALQRLIYTICSNTTTISFWDAIIKCNIDSACAFDLTAVNYVKRSALSPFLSLMISSSSLCRVFFT